MPKNKTAAEQFKLLHLLQEIPTSSSCDKGTLVYEYCVPNRCSSCLIGYEPLPNFLLSYMLVLKYKFDLYSMEHNN